MFFLKNFEIFWKTLKKNFPSTLDENFIRSVRCLFHFSFRICNPFEDRAINDCATVASLTSGRAETIPMQNLLWWRHAIGFSSKVISGTRVGAIALGSNDASRRPAHGYTPCLLVRVINRPLKAPKTDFDITFLTPVTPSPGNEKIFFPEKDARSILPYFFRKMTSLGAIVAELSQK
jgi:hypothetical protein